MLDDASAWDVVVVSVWDTPRVKNDRLEWTATLLDPPNADTSDATDRQLIESVETAFMVFTVGRRGGIEARRLLYVGCVGVLLILVLAHRLALALALCVVGSYFCVGSQPVDTNSSCIVVEVV